MDPISCNVDVCVHSGWETGVHDFGGGVGLVDVAVDLFACFHETVAEMGVLVEGVGVSGECENVFMVAGGEGGCGEGEDWFKDDLCGCAAEIEHPGRGFPFFSSNVAFY